MSIIWKHQEIPQKALGDPPKLNQGRPNNWGHPKRQGRPPKYSRDPKNRVYPRKHQRTPQKALGDPPEVHQGSPSPGITPNHIMDTPSNHIMVPGVSPKTLPGTPKPPRHTNTPLQDIHDSGVHRGRGIHWQPQGPPNVTPKLLQRPSFLLKTPPPQGVWDPPKSGPQHPGPTLLQAEPWVHPSMIM